MARSGPAGLRHVQTVSVSGCPLIGLFGGTFDPVHLGHLRTAQEVLEALDLDDFRFLPTGDPPHRRSRVTAARHRLAMLELAIAGHPQFRIDTRELHRPGPSYMVDTLRDIRAEEPAAALVLIVGQDSANSLDSWHRWNELFGLAHILIMQRPDHASRYAPAVAEALAGRAAASRHELARATHGLVLGVEVTQVQVSSSRIRAIAAQGRSIRYLVPEAVRQYVLQEALYR